MPDLHEMFTRMAAAPPLWIMHDLTPPQLLKPDLNFGLDFEEKPLRELKRQYLILSPCGRRIS